MTVQKKMPDIATKTRRIRRLMLAGVMAGAASLAGCQALSHKHGLTAEQIAVLKQQGFVQTDEGWTLDQSTTMLFALNESTLSETGARNVAKVSKALLAVGLTHLKVVGYTDSFGTDAYNKVLSKRRADTVVQALVDDGIPRAGLDSVGMGKRYPIADNRTEAGRAQNRHVAIIVVVD